MVWCAIPTTNLEMPITQKFHPIKVIIPPRKYAKWEINTVGRRPKLKCNSKIESLKSVSKKGLEFKSFYLFKNKNVNLVDKNWCIEKWCNFSCIFDLTFKSADTFSSHNRSIHDIKHPYSSGDLIVMPVIKLLQQAPISFYLLVFKMICKFTLKESKIKEIEYQMWYFLNLLVVGVSPENISNNVATPK